MIHNSFKLLSISLEKRSFCAEFGFLNPESPEVLETIFQAQRDSLVSGSKPSRFLYRECVLKNCKRPAALRTYAENLAADLAAGKRPDLDSAFLADIKTVTTGTKEADFYLLHQLIEALAGPVLNNLKEVVQIINTPHCEAEVVSRLKEATVQMTKINHVMGAFSYYMPSDAFNTFRPALGMASGAQSTLRFLDFMLFDTLEVGPVKKMDAFKAQLTASTSAAYEKTMAAHANPENFEKDALVRYFFTQGFGKDLEKDFPEFLPKNVAVALSGELSSPVVRAALKDFVGQRAEFKLHHINIVADALTEDSKIGTAGTPHDAFLRSSAMRDIQLHHLLAAELSEGGAHVIQIPAFTSPRKLFTYLARRIEYIVQYRESYPEANKLPLLIVSSKHSQKAGLRGFSGWLHQLQKQDSIHIVPVTINGDPSFVRTSLGRQAINVLSTPTATRLLSGNDVNVNAVASDIDRTQESEIHTTVIMGASGGLGKSVVLEILNEMEKGKRPRGPLLLTYSSDNKAEFMSDMAQLLTVKYGVLVTVKKLNFLSQDPMKDVLTELNQSKYGMVNTLIITTGIGTATVEHLVGKHATVTEKAGCFYDVNVAGPLTAIKQLHGGGLLENEGVGTVVSVVGSVGASDVVYNFDPQDISSKLALEQHMLVLSEQFSSAANNVHIHVQKPGGLDTPMLRASFLDNLEQREGQSEIDRLISDGWLTDSDHYASVLVSMAHPELGAVFSGQSYSSHCALNMNVVPYGEPLLRSHL